MKRIHIIAIIVIILGLILMAFIYFNSDKQSGEQNNPLASFMEYKNECKIFDAQDGEPRIYENKLLDFSFSYPEDSLVCEREVKRYAEDNISPEMEITVWSKTMFINNKVSSPKLIVYINNPDSLLLSTSEILDSEEIEISGIKTYKKLKKSNLCMVEDCPTFTSVNFQYQDNDIEIQSWIDSQSILDSFKFN